MPEDERIVRMNNLRRREHFNDVDFWMKSFLKAMDSLEEETDDIGATSIPPVTIDDFDEYLSKWVSSIDLFYVPTFNACAVFIIWFINQT